MKYNSEKIEKARTTAILSLVKWGKTGLAYFPMRNAVNHYMDVADMNTMFIDGEEGIRRIARSPFKVWRLTASPSSTMSNLQKLTANWTISQTTFRSKDRAEE